MLALTEIGQQFLMLQIDKKITSNDLSILIFDKTIAFCTIEQTLFFDIEKENINSENLNTWISYHNFKKKNKKCVLFESKGALVPKELFDEKNKEIYLSLSDVNLNRKKIATKLIDVNNQVFVFSQSRDWGLLLNKFFFDIEITHFAAELIPFLSNISKDNLKKSVFIHLRKDFFDLFIYQGSQLLFFNSFPKHDEEEFLYYLFFVLEQFYLKTNQFVATFLGKFIDYKKYYDVFEEFHSLTNFTYPEILKINSNHPAPFFSYFNNYENNIRKV